MAAVSFARFTWLAVLLVTMVSLIGCYRKPKVQVPVQTATPKTESKPATRPAFDNLDAHVAYVDDQQCAECHAEIAAQYAAHPMGNSLFAAREVYGKPKANAQFSEELFGEENQAAFTAGAFQYTAKRVDGQLVHARTLGQSPSVQEAHSIEYVVGSGQRGRSYLIHNDDSMFMSPLTWYPKQRIWDLSPGYEHNDLGFTRPVLDDCLFCHSNGANLVPDQKNRYDEKSPFRGHAIGCQRCHGPGEAHVQRHKDVTNIVSDEAAYDRTIANPAKMSWQIREAVCQQCHLAGVARVEKAGRNRYDFRPGMPLDDVLATFVLNPTHSHTVNHFVGQVEQMYASRCFAESNGKLGCISCHDPHSRPTEELKTTFYRDRCLACHDTASCEEPLEERLDARGEDNCVQCHMPSLDTDVRHAATTDHRIPRKPGKSSARVPAGMSKSSPIVRFPYSSDQQESDVRDEAIAMLETALYHPRRVTASQLREISVPLSRYVARRKRDLAARETLADLMNRTRQAGADKHYLQVLAECPQREHSAVMLASTRLAHGDVEEAIQRWTDIVNQRPGTSKYLQKLCEAYDKAGRWHDLRKTSEVGTDRFPTSEDFWRYRAKSCRVLKDRDAANESLEVLIRFRPEFESEIRIWFSKL